MRHAMFDFLRDCEREVLIKVAVDAGAKCLCSVRRAPLVQRWKESILRSRIYGCRFLRVYLRRQLPLRAENRMVSYETAHLRRLISLTEVRIGRKLTDLEIVTL